MNQYDKVKKEIFGKIFELQVYTDKYNYNEDDKIQSLNEYENDELNWILNFNIDEICKLRLLSMFNENYYSIGKPEIKEIFPEADFTSIFITKEHNGDIYVGLLGECDSDIEHGFSLSFKNRNFYAVGQHSDLF